MRTYIVTTLFISYDIFRFRRRFASLKKGKHCLVVDTNMEKLQGIRRKLEEEFALGEKETGR